MHDEPVSPRCLSALDPAEIRAGPTLARLALALGLVAAAVLAMAYFLRAPLEGAGRALVEHTGIGGIAALVLALDPLPGLGFQPGLVLGTAAGVPAWPLFFTASLASLGSSVLGWALGRWGRRLRWLERLLLVSGAAAAVTRWGGRAVAIAGVTPIPFGLATLAAGAVGMPLDVLALAATARWIKIGLSLVAISLGWHAATS
ncbi:MAG: hypothetical protein FJ102_02520 [Deltaproteobacteria bacterium]|nr:hypothetical protein [Deltaproteobacteria bacterium]